MKIGNIKHMSTTDLWEVEFEATKYTVRRWEGWQTGEEEWRVWSDEDGIRHVVEGEKFHDIVRAVLQHLIGRKDGGAVHKCWFCDEKFPTQQARLEHLQSAHEGQHGK